MNSAHEEFEPPLARASLYRDAVTRLNPEALAKELNNPQARFVVSTGDFMLAVGEPQPAEETEALRHTIVRFTAPEIEAVFGRQALSENPVFLGRDVDQASAVFAVTVDTLAEIEQISERVGADVHWCELRQHIDELNDQEIGIFTTVLALTKWHAHGQFSPLTGQSTLPEQGGWMRRDTQSGREIYPRTDPAVIVLITDDDDRVLLGSNLLWEENRFSLLAGFVEAGESLEAAVHREIEEEAGIRVTDLRYVTSQPWPYPQSLMLGFTAKLAGGQRPTDIVPDESELAALRWFTRTELSDPSKTVTLPGKASIARFMLDNWLGDRDGGSGE